MMSLIAKAYSHANDFLTSYLGGVPNHILSAILMALGCFAFVVALRGSPVQKVGLILWFLLP